MPMLPNSILIVPVFVAVAIGLALRMAIVRRRVARAEPTCGKCGYCVRGVPTLVCPECGSDLREVGIFAPGMELGASPKIKSILWTFVLPLPAMLISWALLWTVLPYSVTQKGERLIALQAPYLANTLSVRWRQCLPMPGLAVHGTSAPEELTVINQTTGTFLDLNLSTGGYSYRRADGTVARQPSGMSAMVLANWLGGGAVDPKDSRVLDLASAAYAAITEIPQVTNTGSTTLLRDRNFMQVGVAQPAVAWNVHDEPSPWIVVGLALFWIVIWVFGLRRIHRRRSIL